MPRVVFGSVSQAAKESEVGSWKEMIQRDDYPELTWDESL